MTETVEITVECPFCGQSHSDNVEVSEGTIERILEGRLEEYSIAYDDEKHTCGYELDGDRSCSREVDAPSEYCWQHEDSA